MSLSEDAQRIERDGPPEYDGILWCCQNLVADGHARACHWLSMPRIVAALEAAERLVDAEDVAPIAYAEWQALVAALKEPETSSTAP